jgi:hypothetical protein
MMEKIVRQEFIAAASSEVRTDHPFLHIPHRKPLIRLMPGARPIRDPHKKTM